jgi:Lrp/AsnC family transcriptional regulator
MSGQIDYLLKIVVPDIEPTTPSTRSSSAGSTSWTVSSAFAMERIKNTTALPLGYMQLDQMAKQKG